MKKEELNRSSFREVRPVSPNTPEDGSGESGIQNDDSNLDGGHSQSSHGPVHPPVRDGGHSQASAAKVTVDSAGGGHNQASIRRKGRYGYYGRYNDNLNDA